MSWLRASALGVLFVAAPSLGAPREAEPNLASPSDSEKRSPRLALGLNSLFGVARTSYPAEAFPQVRGYALLLLAHTEVQVTPAWSLAARAPLVLARVEQPAGALYGEGAWGNPQLSLGFRVRPWLRNGWQRTSDADLTVGAPLAEHETEESQLEGRALAIADALEGFSAAELYTPGVVPVGLRGRIGLRGHRWEATGTIGLTGLLRVLNASLSPPRQGRAVGLVSVAAGSVGVWPLPWLGVLLSPRLALRWVPPAEHPSAVAQLLLPAQIQLRMGKFWRLGLTVQAPVGGVLGGTTLAGGVGVATAF